MAIPCSANKCIYTGKALILKLYAGKTAMTLCILANSGYYAANEAFYGQYEYWSIGKIYGCRSMPRN